MTKNENNPFSASASALGYMYQLRYALLESMERLRKSEEFVVSIETLDDVVFEPNGHPLELIQTKHHVNHYADLTDSSPDLWKTIRIWCEGITSNNIPNDSLFFLVTTTKAVEGSAAYYLKPGNNTRDTDKAIERLKSTAESSPNHALQQAFAAFKVLNPEQRNKLIKNVILVDCAPPITDLDAKLKEAAYGFACKRFLDSFLQRLEGWWYRWSINHLADHQKYPMNNEKLEAETVRLREQFKQDSLPIDDDIMTESVEASGYKDRVFVQQLRIIEIGDARILSAIRNYYRAFTQRSRWLREGLIYAGELDRYEDKLRDEWEVRFEEMRDNLAPDSPEQTKKENGKTLYKWAEQEPHYPIRQGAIDPVIPRGSYQMLSELQKVGWHPNFTERIPQILENKEY